jgi:CubicO group peptidase (beta-lactamase class C family)
VNKVRKTKGKIMNINSKLTTIIAFALLNSISCVVSASSDKNTNAPEATASEIKGSFWKMSILEKAFIDTKPAVRKDGLAVGELDVDDGNKEMIAKLAEELADNKHGKYTSLLITHKSKLLFESYYKRGRINLPHVQFSVTKSYISLAFSRAIQLGYLTMADLNKPLVSFLKELDPTKFVKGVEKITLHQAMTMRSGLRFNDEQIKEFRAKAEQIKTIDQIQAYLERSAPITSESQSYEYQPFDPIMVMQVLDTVVPGTAKDFIKNELFDKLGIHNYSWGNEPGGLPLADTGANLISRDMIKLGSLVINNGKWNDEQLISSKFLAKATSKITKATADWHPEDFNYGYFWYQTDITIGNENYDVKIAWGAGGQRIITVDELDLVVVITGYDGEDQIMTQVEKRILPAFVK